jgi:molybdenum cofactor synthesis domain-containing protein
MLDVPDAIRIVLRETAKRILKETRPNGVRSVRDDNLLHAQLAHAVIMQEPGYPPYRASIMDGYAVRVADYSISALPPANDRSNHWTHRIIDKVFAGDDDNDDDDDDDANLPYPQTELPPAFYVTTGAVVPETFDCVVPIEECIVADDHLYLAITDKATIIKNKWIRPIGFDIPAGSTVLERGHVLDPIALGLLRQSGCTEIQIKRPVRVGVLSTGNELLESDTDGSAHSTRRGLIPDVNRPVLLSLLSTFPSCVGIDLGIARDDDVDAMTKLIDSQLEHCEIIVTTGGISLGETDVVEEVIVKRLGGTLHVGRMNMKPGKPTKFVTVPRLDTTRFVFALPGNPVSAIVCTHLLLRPCIDLMFAGGGASTGVSNSDVVENVRRMLANAFVHPETQAILTHDIKLDEGRPEYHRVTVEPLPGGTYRVTSTGVQQSSRLMSMRDADGLLVLPKATSDKAYALTGESYTLLLIRDVAMVSQTRLRDSKHLNKNFKINVVILNPDDNNLSMSYGERIKAALSGSESGTVSIRSIRTFSGSPSALIDFLIDKDMATACDIHVIVCSKFLGEHLYKHLEFSKELRSGLLKVADAMALQARRGAASQNSASALFEVVIGFTPDGYDSLVIFMPEKGLDGGLKNVRGLVKHALEIARDVGRDGVRIQ